MSDARPYERRPRRSRWPRLLVTAGIILLVFVLGLAIGKALNDGPSPPSSVTYVRTLETLTGQTSTSAP
ncbi:MAG: hypothetical protein EXQ81_05340 [Thermoleophilia bacterium]|nr:hypothetical protein [Thermoleophilia bacterium]